MHRITPRRRANGRLARALSAVALVAAVVGAPAAAPGEAPMTMPAHTPDGSGPVALGPDGARITLRTPPAGETAARPAGSEPPAAIGLVLEGVRADNPPGVVYGVWLNLPAGAPATVESPHHVGTLSFFDAVTLPGAEAPGRDRVLPLEGWLAEMASSPDAPLTVDIRPLGEARAAAGAGASIRAVRIERR